MACASVKSARLLGKRRGVAVELNWRNKYENFLMNMIVLVLDGGIHFDSRLSSLIKFI